MSRSPLYERHNLAAGLCCSCPRPRNPGSRRYCNYHLDYRREANRQKNPLTGEKSGRPIISRGVYAKTRRNEMPRLQRVDESLPIARSQANEVGVQVRKDGETVSDYEHNGKLITDADVFYPSIPIPQRLCANGCPTRLSRYNGESICRACIEKALNAKLNRAISPNSGTITRLT